MSRKRIFDSSLVERAMRGDEVAFERIIARAEPMLRSFFISRIGGKTDVDDLVQNTLLRLHRGLADLKDSRVLKSFMMKAAIFELHDYYRGRYSTRELLFDPEHPPGRGYIETESGDKVDVEQVLSVLTIKAREIIELREYGYRYEEIAQKLGTTEAAVKMQVMRAFERIRELFHER